MYDTLTVINLMNKHGPRSRRTQPKKQIEKAMVSDPLAPVYINKLADPKKDPIYNPQKSLTTDNERFISLIEKLVQKKVATSRYIYQANGAEPIAVAVPEVDVAGEQDVKLADEAVAAEGIAQEAEDNSEPTKNVSVRVERHKTAGAKITDEELDVLLKQTSDLIV